MYYSIEELGLQRVAQATSLLEAAISSGDEATIRHVFEAYKRAYPHCLRWQYHVSHGLWNTYPSNVQQQIATAVGRGLDRVTIEFERRDVAVDLAALTAQGLDGKPHALRAHLHSMIHHRNADGEVEVTSVLGDVHDWQGAFVVPVATAAAAAAQDQETLTLLMKMEVCMSLGSSTPEPHPCF